MVLMGIQMVLDARPRGMGMTAQEKDRLEQLAEQAVEHLGLIRKYAAWIAFVVVVTFALSVVGVIYVVVEGRSSQSVDICQEIPGLC